MAKNPGNKFKLSENLMVLRRSKLRDCASEHVLMACFAEFRFLLMQKPDYDNYDYFAVQSTDKNQNVYSDYEYVSRIGELPDYHLFRRKKGNKRAVAFGMEQMVPRQLYKRAEPVESEICALGSNPASDYSHISESNFPTLDKRGYPTIEQVRASLNITDPGFDKQWHLLNVIKPGFDMNVTGVWELGITGKGVTVGFMDDGIDHENEDLKDNFSLEGSYDFNEHKKWPTPALFDDTHGTRCAGEVGAVRNHVCGVGIAYDTKVAGLRILSGKLTVADEAAAINYGYNTTQIYSCSWGPRFSNLTRDDGKTMENIPPIAAAAFVNGIKNGRNGLGSIFVFAAGNGARSEDNCNFDGYTNRVYTITVAAMDNYQQHPQYSEQCSGVLISTYSSAGSGLSGIYTSDWKNGCTSNHGGTSAAAPLAAGIYALLLEARPDLTWRDVQRITVENAVIVNPTDDDWQKNGVGRMYNHKYGYGTFDTYTMIKAAQGYVKVAKQTVVEHQNGNLSAHIPPGGVSNTIQILPLHIQNANLTRLEHVVVAVTIDHQRRGDVSISLKSPSGFQSRLIETRSGDNDANGFQGWEMLSVAHWFQ